MSDKKNNWQPNKWSPATETSTRHDGDKHTLYIEHSYVHSSVESDGTTPIDITLMTGNGQTKEGE